MGLLCAHVGSDCCLQREATVASFAVVQFTLAKAASYLKLCIPPPPHLQCWLFPSAKKATEDKGELPQKESTPAFSGHGSRLAQLENARIVHILTLLRWAQVHSGGASILFLHLWGWEAPMTGRQTDLLLSPCVGCHIECFLRRAWSLEALDSPK